MQPHVYNMGITVPHPHGDVVRHVNENTEGPYGSADELIADLQFADGLPGPESGSVTGGPEPGATLVTSFPPEAVDQLWASYIDAVAAAESIPLDQFSLEYTQPPYRIVEVLGFVNSYTNDPGEKDGELDDGVQLCAVLFGTAPRKVPNENVLWRQQSQNSDEHEGE